MCSAALQAKAQVNSEKPMYDVFAAIGSMCQIASDGGFFLYP
jgi:hypothetical protein